MTAQVLDRVLTCYRIGDPADAYPIVDATGSRLYPGRWNTPTSPMIYTSERFSTALLEKLVHGSGRLPPNQHYVEIIIPPGVNYETFDVAGHPGWDMATGAVSKRYGEAWEQSRRSLVLIVPPRAGQSPVRIEHATKKISARGGAEPRRSDVAAGGRPSVRRTMISGAASATVLRAAAGRPYKGTPRLRGSACKNPLRASRGRQMGSPCRRLEGVLLAAFPKTHSAWAELQRAVAAEKAA